MSVKTLPAGIAVAAMLAVSWFGTSLAHADAAVAQTTGTVSAAATPSASATATKTVEKATASAAATSTAPTPQATATTAAPTSVAPKVTAKTVVKAAATLPMAVAPATATNVTNSGFDVTLSVTNDPVGGTPAGTARIFRVVTGTVVCMPFEIWSAPTANYSQDVAVGCTGTPVPGTYTAQVYFGIDSSGTVGPTFQLTIPGTTSTAVHVKQSSLADHCADCNGNNVSGQLNVTSPTGVTLISVTLSNGTVIPGTSSSLVVRTQGNVMQIIVPLSKDVYIQDAVISVPAGWSGEFVLSHYTCANVLLKDATASVSVSSPTCDATGVASVTGLANATLVGTLDQTVGTHDATFKSTEGHLFANGTDTLVVSYTIAAQLSGEQCTTTTTTTTTLLARTGGPADPLWLLGAFVLVTAGGIMVWRSRKRNA